MSETGTISMLGTGVGYLIQAHHMVNTDWKHLLSNPGEDGHIVQLYQEADFYCDAISHFTAEGFVKGESIILVATDSNWQQISKRLESTGFNIGELFERGQLTLLDANQTLPKFMANGLPDGSIFKTLAGSTIEKARCGGKYTRVRWWGEMVNVLYVEGNGRASHRLEQFFDEVAHEQQIAIFCSFLMDHYDPVIYDEAFLNVCRTHSNVIPMQDYSSHRDAVNEAISEVVGPIEGNLLLSLINWTANNAFAMPSSQTMLLWVRETMPTQFPDILKKARSYDRLRGQVRPA